LIGSRQEDLTGLAKLRDLYWRRLPSWGRTFLASSLLGVSVGLLAAWMNQGMEAVWHWLFQVPIGALESYAAPTRPWLLPIIPALGGLAVGILLKWTCPECFGGGTDDVVAAFHHDGQQMRGRVIPLKWLAACISVGTGAAGGGEGPMSQIGAAAGSLLSRVFGLGNHGRRLMLTAGVAAGVGAFFRAPLGGAVFACEVYYSHPDLEADALLPSLLASVAAYAIFGLLRGFEPLLAQDSASTLLNFPSFAILTALGLICALGARVMIAGVAGVDHVMRRVPLWLRPALGGLIAGAVAWIALNSGHVLGLDPLRPGLALGGLGDGYSLLRMAQSGAMPSFLAVASLLALRFWTSSFALGSQSPVGSFAPAMVLGGLIGLGVSALTTSLNITAMAPGAFALCGMAGFFAAAFRCPLAAVLMILEVSQGHHMLPALMWVAALSYMLGPTLSLVKGQLSERLNVPGRRDF
jgi:CIC family chloride channel protein